MNGMNGMDVMISETASRKEQALWLLEQFTPGTGVNNLSVTVQVDGRLDPARTRAALDAVVARYETLHTVFVVEGDALVRRPTTAGIDLGEQTLPDQDAAADLATFGTFVAGPFAIDGSSLVRATLFHAERDGRPVDTLVVAVHHLIFDTISQPVLLAAFVEAYESQAGFADVVRATVEPEPTERSLRFWRDKLSGFEDVALDLWIGRDASGSRTLQGGTVTRPLVPEAAEVVRTLQGSLRASEAVVLLSAFYLLLARHGAGPDLVVGTPVNSRPQHAPGAIGYHINVVPLRTRVDREAGFRTLVKQSRSLFMSSITHADVPVDSLLDEVERTSTGWRNTLFRHVFNYVPAVGESEFAIAGMPAAVLGVENGASKFDLELFVLPSPGDDIVIRMAYHCDAFSRSDVELLLERFEALLLAAAADLDKPVAELDVRGRTDRAVIDAANATVADPAPHVLTEFLARVAEQPDAVAVVDGRRRVTYAQLADAAARNAHELTAAGLAAGDTVVVAAGRSPELAAAALGTWLAGGVYLPVDPAHPADRIRYQFEDSGARAALRAPGLELPVEKDVVVRDCAAVDDRTGTTVVPQPAERAYLMYTSGSTGKPKGTLLTHANLANLIAAFRTDLAADTRTTVLWSTAFTFDISTLELFLPLACGARLVVAADSVRYDGPRLAALLAVEDVRVLQATPTAWRPVIDALAPVLAGRTVLCGGEPMPAELATRLVATGADVRNVYGPTETCIWSTAGRVTDDGPVTVGTPLRNTTVFVADPAGHDLPLLVPGELCIAGTGVADGYHEREDLTASRFGHREDVGRFYRTGDRAQWLPDGRLQVMGRADRQIKLRGVRIELAEIEAVLNTHPGVRNTGVVLVGDPSADGMLVAFVEPEPNPDAVPPTGDELWAFAGQRLLRSSLPQDFVIVDALPTNTAHKVDYPALTRTAQQRRDQPAAITPPANATAIPGTPCASGAPGTDAADELVALWAEVLERTDVVVDTNFFTHGGHSLLAVRLVQRIAETTGHELALTDLFASPTPVGAAIAIGELTGVPYAPAAAPPSQTSAWQDAARRYWDLAGSDAGMPGALTVECADEVLLLGAGDDRLTITGSSVVLSRLFGGDATMAELLQPGAIRVNGSFAHLSAVLGASWKGAFGSA